MRTPSPQHSRPTLLIVDDDLLVRRRLTSIFESDYEIFQAATGAEATVALRKHPIQLVLLDLNLGGTSGIVYLGAWKQEFPELDIVICSGESRIEVALDCVRRGAADYLPKPIRPDDALWIVSRVLEHRSIRNKLDRLSPLICPRPVDLIGRSASVLELRKCLDSLRGQSHLNILLLGESGTGKEVVARTLHQQEGDSERPFVIVNMPAIPTSLVESELFGVEKGAFTDAKASRPGKFELADGGDIFLDEIGDLPSEVQPKLLRTLQEQVVERVGSSQRPRKVRFRTISATNQSLASLLSQGRFREDLVYRLSDMVLWLPPLRERRDDIPELAEHFLRKHCPAGNVPALSARALEQLQNYAWPGNVRQLESTLKRAMVFNRGERIDEIEIFDLNAFAPKNSRESLTHFSTGETSAASSLSEKRADFEGRALAEALRKHGGDRMAACKELGLSRATFYRKLSAMKEQLT